MADEKSHQVSLPSVRITPTMASILTANVGAMFTPNQLTAIFTPGRIAWHRGCIERLYYGSGDEDLDFFIINGEVIAPENLKDFRQRLREAACCHHCISFCLDQEERTMFMLNVWPCQECRPSKKCDCP